MVTKVVGEEAGVAGAYAEMRQRLAHKLLLRFKPYFCEHSILFDAVAGFKAFSMYASQVLG
jgi:hypothetical protein